ncbi:hypothetical protein O6H91_16G088200 [Diphasiastrum complanatum]|uniref:Uncharacterized protein n=2 Tax=Diphasiastrum complanatum TaxID=34168 RepID=A0ACC2BCV1_DIPCM|nr:hypothetical protein O6H91_16G063200 [Diphasiastrum complanatum]KAJ7528179.1 hypothetical protein O6H91_16G088200 [Diphasiastrum complanatum]
MGGFLTDVPDFQNSLEVQEAAKFAVDEHNRKHNAGLVYSKVVHAQSQVVAGSMFHLTVEALHEEKPKLFHAKVWTKPWENHISLQEFKPVHE